MLCEALPKMEQVTTALASLEIQAVPVTFVHGQLIFSTDVPCLLPATYYNVSIHANGCVFLHNTIIVVYLRMIDSDTNP